MIQASDVAVTMELPGAHEVLMTMFLLAFNEFAARA